uniref:AlNc14C80G5275 protein n=1 Tax=Albugo laibachii Nc14 TaxID=890382 RepID=F0WF83_9STRA|nr:AlNc14C80G5275 [Albugo laibachii Nc14]|eukprot:CCA19865.1 AlNc14C80G5275 [Albugo laibachii Nc14]
MDQQEIYHFCQSSAQMGYIDSLFLVLVSPEVYLKMNGIHYYNSVDCKVSCFFRQPGFLCYQRLIDTLFSCSKFSSGRCKWTDTAAESAAHSRANEWVE